jgi:DmsE family decaheme c-type cytochrome
MRDPQPTARLHTWALAACLGAFAVLGSPPTRAADGADPAAPAAAPAAGKYSQKGADTCLKCHDDPEVAAIFRTPHGRPTDARSPFGHGQLQCEACHGPGDTHARTKGDNKPPVIRFGKKSGTPVATQNEQCLQCHRSTNAHWAGNAHAVNDLSCADCHRAHSAEDPVRQIATQPRICTSCHLAKRTDMLKPSHHPLLEGKMACTACHAPHGSTAPAQIVKETTTALCTSCHTEYRGPFVWEHAPVTDDCANCHQPHGSTQPAMLKTRPPFLCQQCHEAQGHPSVSYTPNGLPGGGGPAGGAFLVAGGCVNCHSQVHGSNHPSGSKLMR